MRTKLIQIKSEVVFLQMDHDEHLLQLIEEHMGRDVAEIVRDKITRREEEKPEVERWEV